MKRYKDTRLSEFFTKVSKTTECLNTANGDASAASEGTLVNSGDVTDANTYDSVKNDENNPNDFGLAVGEKLSDVDKLRFLTNFYTPPESYAWPTATRIDRGRTITCRLRCSELLKYPCFAYSPKLDGVFCTYCALFAANEVGRSKVQTGVFVNVPFQRYTHWSGKVSEHLSRNYHVDAATKAESFIAAMLNPSNKISVKLDRAAQRQIDNNRRVLVPIIESIIFLARCGIPLRGHRDSGRISCSASCADVEVDQGNFRAL
jgi:hypothetical protein